MPNHCTNEVCISCSSEEVAEEIASFLQGEESAFDFNRLHPCPKKLLTPPDDSAKKAVLKARYGHDNWYDWRLENWGTKWNSYECSLDTSWIEDGSLEYHFETAWGPPDEVHRKLRCYLKQRHPDSEVSWFYHEPLMNLAGYLEP